MIADIDFTPDGRPSDTPGLHVGGVVIRCMGIDLLRVTDAPPFYPPLLCAKCSKQLSIVRPGYAERQDVAVCVECRPLPSLVANAWLNKVRGVFWSKE